MEALSKVVPAVGMVQGGSGAISHNNHVAGAVVQFDTVPPAVDAPAIAEGHGRKNTAALTLKLSSSPMVNYQNPFATDNSRMKSYVFSLAHATPRRAGKAGRRRGTRIC